MGLPLYLAMTAAEMAACPSLPLHWGWMACHFSPDGPGLAALPEALPPGAMLILNDRLPCRDHDPARIAGEMVEAADRFGCGCVLLDLERPPTENALAVARALGDALPCPLAVPPGFAEESDRAVFLPPCPLHVPLADHLRPWQGREVWLDFALRQQTITVTRDGTIYDPAVPADRQGGIYDDTLCCQVTTEITADAAQFTLFDIPGTLKRKLEHAAALGVTKAVGLYQELGQWA